jgi:hypothetical protein
MIDGDEASIRVALRNLPPFSTRANLSICSLDLRAHCRPFRGDLEFYQPGTSTPLGRLSLNGSDKAVALPVLPSSTDVLAVLPDGTSTFLAAAHWIPSGDETLLVGTIFEVAQ